MSAEAMTAPRLGYWRALGLEARARALPLGLFVLALLLVARYLLPGVDDYAWRMALGTGALAFAAMRWLLAGFGAMYAGAHPARGGFRLTLAKATWMYLELLLVLPTLLYAAWALMAPLPTSEVALQSGAEDGALLLLALLSVPPALALAAAAVGYASRPLGPLGTPLAYVALGLGGGAVAAYLLGAGAWTQTSVVFAALPAELCSRAQCSVQASSGATWVPLGLSALYLALAGYALRGQRPANGT